ncbi:hypothetical protein FNV43_RR06142 [Rhamnella rubrinervis]|uniref:UmuC domain-containing protein n=1 Tax=Rhamnella rubrinervis TaxID=2594499 RepID=A0A8K0HDD8_9ROSA|nr:hypothetical protein FNV43_RR06142 [Rhamnella rubrinervis]
MPVAKPESSDSRIIAHIDMDCFYVQATYSLPLSLFVPPSGFLRIWESCKRISSYAISEINPISENTQVSVLVLVYSRSIHHMEQRKHPNLRGLPTAVVQYNEWKGGGLIAVSYEARKCGVKRSMRGDEAKEVCPKIQLVRVAVARGKADLNAYRNAGSEVVSILAKKGRCERASIDDVGPSACIRVSNPNWH